MRGFIWILVLLSLSGCANDTQSWISIKNETPFPIYALPYSSEYSNADWIPPGVSDDFYSINCDCLDGFKYFSFYYDSLIILMEDHDKEPIKFYQDGTTVNYNPALNPFINEDVWKVQVFDKDVYGSAVNTTEEKQIYEYYFCIEEEHVKSLNIEDFSDSSL